MQSKQNDNDKQLIDPMQTVAPTKIIALTRCGCAVGEARSTTTGGCLHPFQPENCSQKGVPSAEIMQSLNHDVWRLEKGEAGTLFHGPL